MSDGMNGAMSFTLHVTPPASFHVTHTRFPTVRGTWFDVDVETRGDDTLLVALVGAADERYELSGPIPPVGSSLRISVSWTKDYVMLRLEGHEVARRKRTRVEQP